MKTLLCYIAFFASASLCPVVPKAPDVPLVAATRVPLPNDCAITASEAFSRIQATGMWVRYMYTVHSEPGGSKEHMVVVWQPYYQAPIFVYDLFYSQGTAVITGCSREESEIIRRLNTLPSMQERQIHIDSGYFLN